MVDGIASEAAAWGALVIGAGSIGLNATFWVKLGRHLAKADSAERMASAALARTELLSGQLGDAKVDFAKEYVTNVELTSAELRLTQSINSLHDGMRDLRGDMKEIGRRLDGALDRHGRT